jgi:NAD(P)-dependent dehydrogenase (short-subunit alcohol dehydrogenase family)
MDISGRVAIITGASSGIGAATARELARRGAKVVLAARRADQLQILVEEIVRESGCALAVPTDLRERSDIDRLVQTTAETFGRIDLLINNAGVGGGSSIFDKDEVMHQLVTVNLLAPARLVQAALPSMRQQRGGMIINIGSVVGEIGMGGMYAATKFGLRGLSEAMRRELRQDNISVVLIALGFIRTPMSTDFKGPMPGPEVVARTIAKAIRRPRRTIIIPWPYRLLIYGARLFPGVADWFLGSAVMRRRVNTFGCEKQY